METAFDVEIPEDNVRFTVEPGQTLVDAAESNGVQILTGCTDGKCGTCLVKVLAGEVEHRDTVLSDEQKAQGWMCACVSRARSETLSLELL